MTSVRVLRVMVTPWSRRSQMAMYFLPLMFLFHIANVHCAHVFNAYRLIQYDKHGAQFGSRRVTVNFLAASSKATANTVVDKSGQGDLSRMISVLPLRELTQAKVEELVDTRRASGVLVILPKDLNTAVSDSNREQLLSLELYLATRELDVPFYFAFEDADLEAIHKQLDDNPLQDGAEDRYQFVVSASEASVVSSVTSHNFQVV